MSGVPLNIDFQQILLHLLNVVILFAILFFLIYKPVKNFMDKRSKEYQDMDDAANSKLKDAEDLRSNYEARIRQAEEEIQTMRSIADKAMDVKAEEAEQQAREQAAAILSQARQQAQQERDKIIGQGSEELAQIAREAASRVVFRDPSEAYESFLNAAEGQAENGK